MRIPLLESICKALIQKADWEESKHPRADNGQFGSGAGGRSSSKKPKNLGKRPKRDTTQPDHSKSSAIPKLLGGSSALDKLQATPKLTPEQMKTVQTYRKRIKSDHMAIRKELRSVFGKDNVEARVKKTGSIAEKLRRKPEKYKNNPANLQDISGLRIVSQNKSELDTAVKEFKSKYGAKIIPGTEDDFYKNPQSPDPGYRAYHATIEQNGMPHEVQIKTKNMGIWSECNHPIYKNDDWTNGVGKDPEVQAFMKAAAEVYQRRDLGEVVDMPEAPKQLRELDGWRKITAEFGWG